MNLSSLSLDPTALLDLAAILTKGHSTANGLTLSIADLYVWGFLAGGPLLILGGLWMVRRMFVRVKFFALEFGEGGFFGRLKAIFPYLVLGAVMLVSGAAATYLGWQLQGYTVTLTANGLTETTRSQTFQYPWQSAESASERIKSTEFWVSFQQGSRKCRVLFQQRYIGESLQDKAIAIADNALSSHRVRRVKD